MHIPFAGQALVLAQLVTLAALALPQPAQAQARTGSLGGGAGSGPVMTRDELRACLKSQQELKQRVADYEVRKTAMVQERQALEAESRRVGGSRDAVIADAGKVEAFKARQEELRRKFDDWNERFTAFEKAEKTGPAADREKRRLMNERAALEQEGVQIEAERKGMVGSVTGSANEVLAATDALNARVTAFNQRNREMVKLGEDLEQERLLWADECGNRRYREDDETAIKQGR